MIFQKYTKAFQWWKEMFSQNNVTTGYLYGEKSEHWFLPNLLYTILNEKSISRPKNQKLKKLLIKGTKVFVSLRQVNTFERMKIPESFLIHNKLTFIKIKTRSSRLGIKYMFISPGNHSPQTFLIILSIIQTLFYKHPTWRMPPEQFFLTTD